MSLTNRKPMARGKGFKRMQVAGSAPRRSEAPCGVPTDSPLLEHHQVAALKPLRRGTYAVMGNLISAPKTEAHRNPHLLSMARGRPCLFRIPGVCNFDPETTVACHSNLSIHGKAGARKADDEYSAWGCFTCHSHIDQGKGDATAKELAFMGAHLAQVCEWRAIAASAGADPKDIAAARWALDHLNATPHGMS